MDFRPLGGTANKTANGGCNEPIWKKMGSQIIGKSSPRVEHIKNLGTQMGPSHILEDLIGAHKMEAKVSPPKKEVIFGSRNIWVATT